MSLVGCITSFPHHLLKPSKNYITLLPWPESNLPHRVVYVLTV
jgi:hypothetical protein